jgi:hypothetical protein
MKKMVEKIKDWWLWYNIGFCTHMNKLRKETKKFIINIYSDVD